MRFTRVSTSLNAYHFSISVEMNCSQNNHMVIDK